MNIFVSENTLCLGMLPISGSLTSENIIHMINTTLKEFEIPEKSISAVTCDGASVMKKIARISPFELESKIGFT